MYINVYKKVVIVLYILLFIISSYFYTTFIHAQKKNKYLEGLFYAYPFLILRRTFLLFFSGMYLENCLCKFLYKNKF